MKFVIRSQAHDEYVEAITFYLGEFSPMSADRFTKASDDALAAMIFNPFLLREIETGVRAKFLKKFPYSIIYEVIGEDIIVYAYMHQSREPGYWRDRR